MMKRITIIAIVAMAALMIIAGGFFLYIRRMPVEPLGDMIEPLWSRPKLVQAGGDFTIRLKADKSPAIDKVTLQNSRFPAELEYSLTVRTIKFDAKSRTADIVVALPPALPEYLYDLNIWYKEGENDVAVERQPGAVKPRRPRNGTFTFAVVTGFEFSGDLESSEAKYKKTGQFMSEINLLNPDFAVVLGGVAQSFPTANSDSFALYNAVGGSLDVPVFHVPNKFDVRKYKVAGITLRNGRDFWNGIFGESHFSFDMEGYRFIGLDSAGCAEKAADGPASQSVGCFSGDELKWLEGQLEDSARGGMRTVLFLHHEPSAGTWTDDHGVTSTVFEENSRGRLMYLCRKYAVSAVFSDNVQKNSVKWENGTYFVTTASQGGSGEPAMRLVTVHEGQIQPLLISYIRDPNTVPLDGVSAVFRSANNGTAKSNTLVISNALGRPVNNLSAVAIMPLKGGGGDYSVEGAGAVFQAEGHTAHYVFINCDLMPGEKKIVTIR